MPADIGVLKASIVVDMTDFDEKMDYAMRRLAECERFPDPPAEISPAPVLAVALSAMAIKRPVSRRSFLGLGFLRRIACR